MFPASLQSLVVDAKKDDARLNLTKVAACAVVPPVVEFVAGQLTEGSRLGLDGTFFGTNPPEVSIEYARNGKYFREACPLVKKFPRTDESGNRSCMNPLTGRSSMSVLYPKLPPGAKPTGYLILVNPIGMCSYYLLSRESKR